MRGEISVNVKYQLEGQQGRQSLMVLPDSETCTLVVHCRMRLSEVRGERGDSPSWPDILMQAEAGNKLCLKWNPWELKQGEDVCCHRVLPHSHPQPVLPACPAGLLVELIVPLCAVQGVAPKSETF